MLGVQRGSEAASLVGQEGDPTKVAQKEAMLAALCEDAG